MLTQAHGAQESWFEISNANMFSPGVMSFAFMYTIAIL